VFACTALIALFAAGLARAEIASKSYVDNTVATLPAMPNGNDYLLKSGGTMTGEIAMGGQKITGLGAPTAAADAVTKAYVDERSAPAGGFIPWETLRAYADTTATNDPHWGNTWEARVGAHMIRGVAACLSTETKSGNAPDASTYGPNCWCRVSSVNSIDVDGAWVFNITHGSKTGCISDCAVSCCYCVINGTTNSCSRAALFAG
jgi:hypothetical protein